MTPGPLWTLLKLSTAADGGNMAAALHRGAAMRARQGQEIYSSGDPADTVFLLLEGQVALTVEAGRREPEERNTLLLRAPAVFGDRDALIGNEYVEGARCLLPAWLLSFGAELFRKEWQEDASLCRALALDASRRSACSARLRAVDELSLEERLPKLLKASEITAALVTPRYLRLLTNAAGKSITRAQGQSGPTESDPVALFHVLESEVFAPLPRSN